MLKAVESCFGVMPPVRLAASCLRLRHILGKSGSFLPTSGSLRYVSSGSPHGEAITYRGDIPKLEKPAHEEFKSSIEGDIFSNKDTTSLFDREFQDIKLDDYAVLYRDDPTGDHKELISTIIKEYESVKYNTLGRVPTSISVEHMSKIMEECQNVAERERYFNYLFTREMAKQAFLRKMNRKKELASLKKAQRWTAVRTGLLDEYGKILYGLWHNSLFCRIPEQRLKSGMSESRLCEAALFGRKLIFDFGYEEYMKPHIYQNALEQVTDSLGLNRYNYRSPYDIWFCNLKPASYASDYMAKVSKKDLCTSFITRKNDCFTNYFDKSRLVYLSPHATESLKQNIFKSDDIYIIGVFNDKGGSLPISLRKANLLGVRARKLPLDEHIAWHSSTKSLCINHVTGILLEVMSNGGDWKSAFFKHIPSRKIKTIETIIEEENKRRKKRPLFNIREDFDW